MAKMRRCKNDKELVSRCRVLEMEWDFMIQIVRIVCTMWVCADWTSAAQIFRTKRAPKKKRDAQKPRHTWQSRPHYCTECNHFGFNNLWHYRIIHPPQRCHFKQHKITKTAWRSTSPRNFIPPYDSAICCTSPSFLSYSLGHDLLQKIRKSPLLLISKKPTFNFLFSTQFTPAP